MKQPHIDRRCVKRLVYATSFLLQERLKEVAPPQHDGMKNNTVKTHLVVLHMSEDIENFGVPKIFNSAYAESAHIPIAKKTVKNTQKRNKKHIQSKLPTTATWRTWPSHMLIDRYPAKRMVPMGEEMVVVVNGLASLSAFLEMAWVVPNVHGVLMMTGRNLTMTRNVHSRLIGIFYKPWLSTCYHVRNLPSLTVERSTDVQKVYYFTVLTRPKYEDKAWYDHALVDWDDVALPARILSIVNLHNLKPNSKIKFPGQDVFIGESGLYVIIQSYDIIDTVVAELAAKEVSMHVSPKKRRRKKRRRLIPIAATATPSVDVEELLEENDGKMRRKQEIFLQYSSENHTYQKFGFRIVNKRSRKSLLFNFQISHRMRTFDALSCVRVRALNVPQSRGSVVGRGYSEYSTT